MLGNRGDPACPAFVDKDDTVKIPAPDMADTFKHGLAGDEF
jgi:hypothetical protein